MRTLVLSTLALGALATTALAEPVTTAAPAATTGPIALTDEQMDQVTAGQQDQAGPILASATLAGLFALTGEAPLAINAARILFECQRGQIGGPTC